MRQLKIPWSILIATLLLNGWSLLTLTPVAAVTFSAPEGVDGAPQRETTGGATRNGGQCDAQTASREQAIATPLLPTGYPGLTVSERPTFFAYVPQTGAKEASFSLQDVSGNLIYRTKVALPVRGGVVGISLPKTVSALEVGKNYNWFLEIHCLPDIDPDNPVVNGWVRRTDVNPGLAKQLENAATFHDRAVAYARAGIWYEAVSHLVEARRLDPQNSTLSESWEELLTSVGLGAIAAQPLNNL